MLKLKCLCTSHMGNKHHPLLLNNILFIKLRVLKTLMIRHRMMFPYLKCTVFPCTIPVSSREIPCTLGPKGNDAQKDMTLFLTGLEIDLVKELVCLATVIK